MVAEIAGYTHPVISRCGNTRKSMLCACFCCPISTTVNKFSSYTQTERLTGTFLQLLLLNVFKGSFVLSNNTVIKTWKCLNIMQEGEVAEQTYFLFQWPHATGDA